MGLLLPDGRCRGCDGAAPPLGGGTITDRIALGLAILVALALAADFLFQGGSGTLFIARKFADLTQYIAFWR